MFGNSWRIGRVAGIDVRIDASWTFVALLIGYSFYVQIRLGYRETTFGSAALLAAVAAVLFFGSVFLHELAHALTSLRKGIRVHDITLFIFGGVTRADVGSKTPGDEFTIALVGPLTSLVLGGLCFAAAAGADAAGAAEPVVGTIAYLGSVNVVLGLFNLVPGYPLDGGRLLRSAIWRVSGDPDRATTTAAAIGQGISGSSSPAASPSSCSRARSAASGSPSSGGSSCRQPARRRPTSSSDRCSRTCGRAR